MNTKDIPTIQNMYYSLKVLQNSIFKGLDNKSAKEFHTQFRESIPIGADLSKVYLRWSIRLLKRIRVYASDDSKVDINKIIDLLSMNLIGQPIDCKEIENITNVAYISCCHVASVAAQIANQIISNKTDSIYSVVNNASDIVANAAAINERKKQRDDLLNILGEMKI